MNLGEIFRSNVITVAPDDTMIDAMRQMQQQGVGAVVVVEEGEVVGMLTDRDVALAVVLGTATPDSAVRETMSRNVATIWEDQGVFDATQTMQGRHVRRLPIVSRENELTGMVAFDDIVALLAKEFHNLSQAITPALAGKSY